MRARLINIAQAACGIAVFSAVGFMLVKLGFVLVCWIGGHDILEALLGAVVPIALGAAIGIESFLWFREWRAVRTQSRSPFSHDMLRAHSSSDAPW